MTNFGHRAPVWLGAAILAGGISSRMGVDKALLRLEPEGPALLEMTVQRSAEVASDIVVIAPTERDYRRFGVETIPDDRPNQGVLGGILTAVRYFGGASVLVLACDHPFLSVDLLRHMAEIDDDCDVIIPRTRGASRQGGAFTLQTLHAVYRPTCADSLEAVLAQGYASAMDFFDRVRLCALDEPELRQFDPNLDSLISVNTPEALAAARQRLSKRSD
jgi:molybdopterin-guanine dinucleotide biosynthesis protein A